MRDEIQKRNNDQQDWLQKELIKISKQRAAEPPKPQKSPETDALNEMIKMQEDKIMVHAKG